MVFTLDIWQLITFGIGVWILIDGLVFGFLPETMSRLMEQMRQIMIEDLRMAGFMSAALGLLIVFIVVYPLGAV